MKIANTAIERNESDESVEIYNIKTLPLFRNICIDLKRFSAIFYNWKRTINTEIRYIDWIQKLNSQISLKNVFKTVFMMNNSFYVSGLL